MPGRVVFTEERCKGCGLCVDFCPPRIISLSGRRNQLGYRPAEVLEMGGCTGCTLCARMCPDAAIEVYRSNPRAAGAAASREQVR